MLKIEKKLLALNSQNQILSNKIVCTQLQRLTDPVCLKLSIKKTHNYAVMHKLREMLVISILHTHARILSTPQ